MLKFMYQMLNIMIMCDIMLFSDDIVYDLTC